VGMKVPAPLVYLDANVFIYLVEGGPDVAGPIRPLFDCLRSQPGIGVTSEITLAEVLSPPRRPNAIPHQIKRGIYLDLLVNARFIEMEPVSRDILVDSADLREQMPLKLVDAVHLVTSKRCGCSHFVSGDADFRRMLPGMSYTATDQASLSSLLAPLQ
jgi:predicted nucleic acid-binding protein